MNWLFEGLVVGILCIVVSLIAHSLAVFLYGLFMTTGCVIAIYFARRQRWFRRGK